MRISLAGTKRWFDSIRPLQSSEIKQIRDYFHFQPPSLVVLHNSCITHLLSVIVVLLVVLVARGDAADRTRLARQRESLCSNSTPKNIFTWTVIVPPCLAAFVQS
jgi:hypothetical protein